MRVRRPSAWFGNKGRVDAFSLVEVAMALGIASFVLISLLGLMTVSLNAGKRAYEDTSVAAIAQTVASEVRTNSFSSLFAQSFDRYFAYDGVPLPSADGAYYRCSVSTMVHSSPELPEAMRKAANAVRLRLTFFCPPSNPSTNEIFETTIAKY